MREQGLGGGAREVGSWEWGGGGLGGEPSGGGDGPRDWCGGGATNMLRTHLACCWAAAVIRAGPTFSIAGSGAGGGWGGLLLRRRRGSASPRPADNETAPKEAVWPGEAAAASTAAPSVVDCCQMKLIQVLSSAILFACGGQSQKEGRGGALMSGEGEGNGRRTERRLRSAIFFACGEAKRRGGDEGALRREKW